MEMTNIACFYLCFLFLGTLLETSRWLLQTFLDSEPLQYYCTVCHQNKFIHSFTRRKKNLYVNKKFLMRFTFTGVCHLLFLRPLENWGERKNDRRIHRRQICLRICPRWGNKNMPGHKGWFWIVLVRTMGQKHKRIHEISYSLYRFCPLKELNSLFLWGHTDRGRI